jgi:hypothetical protein
MMLADKQAVIIIKEDATGLDKLGLTGQQAADYAAKHAGKLGYRNQQHHA